MVKQFKGERVDTFHRLIGELPIQHGTPPPSDEALANSHHPDCLCSHCLAFESIEQEDNNQLWIDSIINPDNQ